MQRWIFRTENVGSTWTLLTTISLETKHQIRSALPWLIEGVQEIMTAFENRLPVKSIIIAETQTGQHTFGVTRIKITVWNSHAKARLKALVMANIGHQVMQLRVAVGILMKMTTVNLNKRMKDHSILKRSSKLPKKTIVIIAMVSQSFHLVVLEEMDMLHLQVF